MDEAWERAVEAARGGEDPPSVRSLTLDSALKCSQGRLPSASLLEQFSQLRVLSIANVGLASLAEFPSLAHLERLILSDNRIAGGLEFLVEAGLLSLRDLDLSNNKIQLVEDLAPLAQLNLLSLDLYECPVTRLPNYRAKVFSLIKSLQYLDKADAEDNERPESDEEEEDDEDDVEDDLGDGLDADGDDEDLVKSAGRVVSSTGAEDEDEADEDDEKDEDGEESDELDEEDEDVVRYPGLANNFAHSNDDSGSEEEEVDDEEDGENVEVQDIEESEEEEAADDEEDAGEGVEEDEDDEEEEEEGTELASGAFGGAEGEIDAQDDGEDELGDEGEDADEGVDNDDVEDDEDEEEDYGTEYLVKPIAQSEEEEGASDFEPGEDVDEEDWEIATDEEEEDDEKADKERAAASLKRKRAKDQDDDSEKDERHPKH